MFETEAEEYIKEHTFFDEEYGVQNLDVVSKTIFKDAAEFGYNKANEWHYNEPTKSKNNFYVILKNGNHRICYWDMISKADKCLKNVVNGEHIPFDFIKCWKEIVLPELKEIE